MCVECKNAALLSLIPILCPSNARIKTPGDKKTWRPTIAESIDAFICHIKVRYLFVINFIVCDNILNKIKLQVPAELERVKRQRRERYAKLKETVQPYIIAVGSELTTAKEFYIIIDDILYKFENVLRAVDITYKIFQVLHIKYPSACEQIWLFLQKYVYGYTTKWDKHDKSVMNLIDKLQRI